MRLTNSINTPSFKSLDLITIGGLKRGKDYYITGLEFVRGIGGKTVQNNNVVVEVEL